MNIIIVGCGRLGAELAFRVFQHGNQVAVIDRTASAFNNLPAGFHGRTVEGEALNREVLVRAGIEKADGLAAVTNSDALNAVVAHAARTTFQVRHVYVRNYDQRWRQLHESFGLQVVSSASWGAQRIEELLSHGDLHTVFSAGNGEIEVYEFLVPDPWIGKRVGELLSGVEAVPVALTRAGRSFLPGMETVFEEDDLLNLSATLAGIQQVRQRILPEGEA
jgi:trk system potassium uptake protein TrkA